MICYFKVKDNKWLQEWIAKADSYSIDTGFGFFFWIGILENGTLIVSLGIFIILTFLLLKEKFQKF